MSQSTYMGDACVVTGISQDQNGNQKPRFTKVGAWFQNDRGISIKLEVTPFPTIDQNGNPACWIKLFDKKEQQNNNRQNSGSQQQNNGGYRGRY